MKPTRLTDPKNGQSMFIVESERQFFDVVSSADIDGIDPAQLTARSRANIQGKYQKRQLKKRMLKFKLLLNFVLYIGACSLAVIFLALGLVSVGLFPF